MVKGCVFTLVVFSFCIFFIVSCGMMPTVKYSFDNLEASGYYYKDWKRHTSGEVLSSVSDPALTPVLMAIRSGKVSEAVLEDMMDLVTLEASVVNSNASWSTRPSSKEFLVVGGMAEPKVIKGVRFIEVEVVKGGSGAEKYMEIRALKQEGNKWFVFKEPLCTKDGKFIFNKDESCGTSVFTDTTKLFQNIRAYYQKDIDKMHFEPFEIAFHTKSGDIKMRQGR